MVFISKFENKTGFPLNTFINFLWSALSALPHPETLKANSPVVGESYWYRDAYHDIFWVLKIIFIRYLVFDKSLAFWINLVSKETIYWCQCESI